MAYAEVRAAAPPSAAGTWRLRASRSSLPGKPYVDITAELYAGAPWDDFRFYRPAGAPPTLSSR